MEIRGATALVTGAGRGLGLHFVEQLLERGATKVYATARDPEQIEMRGVIRLPLDVTDVGSVARAATAAHDVSLLINNAGIFTPAGLVFGESARVVAELDTNFWGPLRMIRAFAPALAGGAVLNVLSVASWRTSGPIGSYGVSKAAAWSMTNAVRDELSGQGTQVLAMHLGATDTAMMQPYDIPKGDPAVAVAKALDALEQGRTEVLVDEEARIAKTELSADPDLRVNRLDAVKTTIHD